MQIIHFQKPDKEFEEFIKNSDQGSVSQSFHWGKLQKTVPSRGKSWAFAVKEKEDEKIIGTCVLIKHNLGKKNCYLYAHRGPVCAPNKINIFQVLLKECDRIAKEEKAVFLRIDPMWYFEDFDGENSAEAVKKIKNLFGENGFIPAHAQYQPLSTLQLDLTKSEEELRSEMRSMGKRNLKKAEKAGLQISFTADADGKELKEFDKLNKITTERDGFYAHNIDYYQRILRTLGGENNIAKLYSANHQDKYLAMALTTFYGKEAIYYYGASSNGLRELHAPYLLQWEMIKEAKKRGCTRYDFLGISPEPYLMENEKWGVWMGDKEVVFGDEKSARDFCEKKHSFAKITFFKTRWGGRRKDYVGAWEKVYESQKYKMLLWTKKVRKLVRKLGIRI